MSLLVLTAGFSCSDGRRDGMLPFQASAFSGFLRWSSSRLIMKARIMARLAGIFALLFCFSVAIRGQGALIGFEEYTPGSLPAFIRPPPQSYAAVEASLTQQLPAPVLPYEGSRLLHVAGETWIYAPDLQPILQYSLHLYAGAGLRNSPRLDFTVAGAPGRLDDLGTWAKYEGMFSAPQDYIVIRGFYGFTETFNMPYGIDNVLMVTIPEPTIVSLLFGGIYLLFTLRRKRRPLGEG